MSPRLAWIAFALCIVLGLTWLFFTRSRVNGPGGATENLPQLSSAPGIVRSQTALWGRPNRDLYPSLDSPKYVSAQEADAFLKEDDEVFVVRAIEESYVFPQVLLAKYHVVNDTINSEPVAVTSCLLAGSTALFSRRIGEKVITLGLTGQLYCGNSVLFDRETQTDWLQLNGEPLQGVFFGRARLTSSALEPVPWGRVKHRDNLRVLAPVGLIGEYRSFKAEIEESHLGQRVVESQQPLDSRLLPYTKGLGIRVQGETRFYPERADKSVRLEQQRVGGWSVLILRGDYAGPCRVFRRHCEDKTLEFEWNGDGIIDRNTDSRWNDQGECVSGPLLGKRLERASYSNVYWFVWSSLYPDTNLGS